MYKRVFGRLAIGAVATIMGSLAMPASAAMQGITYQSTIFQANPFWFSQVDPTPTWFGPQYTNSSLYGVSARNALYLQDWNFGIPDIPLGGISISVGPFGQVITGGYSGMATAEEVADALRNALGELPDDSSQERIEEVMEEVLAGLQTSEVIKGQALNIIASESSNQALRRAANAIGANIMGYNALSAEPAGGNGPSVPQPPLPPSSNNAGSGGSSGGSDY